MNAGFKKWAEVVRFELVYQLGRKSTLLFFALFLLMMYGQINGDVISAREEGISFGAPIFVARTSAGIMLIALLVIAAIAGDAATRDVQLRMEPLLRSAPLKAATYIGGRVAGAFLVVALLLIAVPIGMMLFAPPPLRAVAYLQSYLLIVLPNAFVATALLFALASLVRHMVGSYIAAALLFATSLVSQMFIGGSLGQWELAKLLDATGITALRVMARTWSPADLHARTIATENALLTNRALWIAIAIAFLAIAYARSSSALAPRQRGEGGQRPGEGPRIAAVHAPQHFTSRAHLHQTLTIARDSLREIATGWIWIVLPLLVLQTAMNLQLEAVLDTPILRTAGPLLQALDDPLNTVVLFVLLLAGELVWRERDANIQALLDPAPVPEWVRFAGRLLSIGFVVLVLHALLLLAALLFSADRFELAPYLQVLFGIELAGTLAFALFAWSLHILVNQKHVGLVLGIVLSVVLPQVLPDFGITHPLLVDSLDPIWRYSDISGFAPFLPQALWLELYWFLWAVLLAIVAPLRIARSRFTRRTGAGVAIAFVLIVLVGGFIFYNTNVLNAYAAPTEGPQRRAEYERRYEPFEKTPQPELTATKLHVELYPERREAHVRGTHRLVNQTAHAIDTIHIAVATSSDVETSAIQFDLPARATVLDDHHGHRTYVLIEPLKPGESLQLQWRLRYDPRGFPARNISTDVVANGTFFVMQDWMPLIGYQPARALTGAGERRLHGLPERPFVASLDDPAARQAKYARSRIHLDATIGTAANQTAVTSGELRRTWTHNGRRYFHYATSAPIGNEFAVFSARYAVRRSRWRDVNLELVHHPEHDLNAQRMLRSMEVSLAQFSARFGPYPHKVLRMVEYPAAGSSMHAGPGTIWFKEQFALLDPDRHPQQLDLPFAATAHEVAHQWWGGQLRNARAEGIILLSESLAWYSAMGVVQQEYGDAHLQRLLAAMRRAYLDPRSRAGVPLLRATDWFSGYRKGAFAMYALREYVGQQQVDLALRRLLAAHAKPEQPLALSTDLLRELQQVTPPSLHSLLGDLFERNTFWELKTSKATARPAANGQWQVSVDVVARKVMVDAEGKEREVPMNDLIEIGAFTDADGKPMHLSMHRIRSGAQTITITVPRRPARAGIDPRHLLIDAQTGDNVAAL